MSDVVIRALNNADWDAVTTFLETLSATKQPIHPDRFVHWYTDVVMAYPQATIADYHAVFLKKTIVAVIHTRPFVLRYGRAVLNVAGIDLLCVHPDYTALGYAEALLKELLTHVAEQGVHLVLHYVDNVDTHLAFSQFGFSPVWADYSVQIPTSEASALAQPLQMRVALPRDLPTMAELYARQWGQRVTCERNGASWRWHIAHSRGQAMVVVDERDAIWGYLWHLPDDFSTRVEVIAESPAAIRTCLAYSGRRWQQAGYDTFRWCVPPDDVIIPFAQQMVSLTLNASYFPNRGWLGRIIDARAMLQALLSEIIAQAKVTRSDIDWSGFVLSVAPNGVDIGLRQDSNSQCHLSLRDFMQVLFGTLRPETLAVREPLSSASVQLLEALFPPRIAALAPYDWF
ncbi:MAG: GNAT family N-acetyltransferase [Chloroflexota bacterium]